MRANHRYLGHIDLGTVTEVRGCTRQDAPPHALDLVTDARVFSLAPATPELMQEWRHRIHAVVGACATAAVAHCYRVCVCGRTVRLYVAVLLRLSLRSLPPLRYLHVYAGGFVCMRCAFCCGV